VAIAPNGRSAYVTGGGSDGILTRVDWRSGHVHAPIALGRHPRGIAVTRDRALVALNGDAAVAIVTLKSRKVTRIATKAFPSAVALSPDGRRALVTHDGFEARSVTPVDMRRRRAGRAANVGHDPAGVAFTPSGRRALVAVAGAVELVNGRTGRRVRTIKQRGAPRLVAMASGRAIVADGGTGRLTAIGVK
jgi:DNA-binding beta-propeller fold protein YncE